MSDFLLKNIYVYRMYIKSHFLNGIESSPHRMFSATPLGTESAACEVSLSAQLLHWPQLLLFRSQASPVSLLSVLSSSLTMTQKVLPHP